MFVIICKVKQLIKDTSKEEMAAEIERLRGIIASNKTAFETLKLENARLRANKSDNDILSSLFRR